MGWMDKIFTKKNPAQPLISAREPISDRTLRKPYTAGSAFSNVAVFNRCVNMIIDSAAQVTYDIKDKYKFTPIAEEVTPAELNILLNVRPNPYMDISTFRRLIVTDLIFEGAAYVHWDGASLYHVPAALMQVKADSKTYINSFTYGYSISRQGTRNVQEFNPSEIIFIKDNAYTRGATSQITGQSRVNSVLNSVNRREKMLEFKEKYLDNGTVIGLILETDELLNKKAKERKQEEIQLDYNPITGRQTVIILDGGLKAKPYAGISSFKDLDFSAELAQFDKDVYMSTGIPSALIEGGNNANIRPNVELLYYMTILPMLSKFQASLESFFGYKIKLSTDDVAALNTDKATATATTVSLVNNGLITGNEGRENLRLPPSPDERLNEIRIPVNVAGSATGLSGQEGGRPSESTEEE